MNPVKKKELVEFGLYLSKLREASGFRTKSELAKVSGISIATISRIESGIQRAHPETLKVLSTYLKGVTYEDLLEKLNYLEKKEAEQDSPPQVKRIALSLERAAAEKKVNEEDLEYIAEQVERLIEFAERKNS